MPRWSPRALVGVLTTLAIAGLAFAPAQAASPAVLVGKVTDTAGKALSGADVSLQRGSSYYSTTTDTAGAYDTRKTSSTKSLPAGTYTVSVSVWRDNAKGYPYAQVTKKITLSAGKTTRFNASLREASTLDVTIVDTAGKNVKGAFAQPWFLNNGKWEAEQAGGAEEDGDNGRRFVDYNPGSGPSFVIGALAPTNSGLRDEFYGTGDPLTADKATVWTFDPKTIVHKKIEIVLDKGLPITASTPSIAGTAKVGSTLKLAALGWAPSGLTTYGSWYAGSTYVGWGTSYKVTNAAAGKKITVVVTASKTGYARVSKRSAATATVVGVLSPKTPTISGTAKKGKTLKAKTSAWGPSKVTLRYQWYRNGKKISKATKTSYKLTTKDVGKKITVKVTGSKTSYATTSRTSKATSKVKK